MAKNCENCTHHFMDEENTEDDWWWVPECENKHFPHGGPVLEDASTCPDYNEGE